MSGKRKKPTSDSLPDWAQEPEALPDWAQEPTPNIQEDWGDAANSGASVQQPPVGPESVATATGSPAPEHAGLYDFLRAGAQAAGMDPLGLIPDERTARGAVASALQGNAYAPNFMDEMAGLLSKRDAALANLRKPRGEQVDPDWAYRHGRDTFRQVEGEFRDEHPLAAFGLTAVAGALSNPVSVQGGRALNLARYAPAAAQGAIAGAGAAPESDTMARSAAAGASLGVAGQALGEGVGGLVAKGVDRLARGFVEPSEAARYLQSKGVDNLTIAQQAPGSKLAQLEEAATFSGGAGPGIRAMRDAGKQSWQTATANEALAPGMAPLPMGTSPADAQQAIAQGFNAAYAVAKGHPVAPDSIQSALYAVDDPGIYATDGARASVAKFIRNQITALRQDPAGAVDSGDVIALRSTLRARIRALIDATDGTSAQERDLFQAVADELSNVLDAQLPPKAANMLRAADEQYGNFVTLGQAVRSAKDMPSGFSPTHLQNAVAARTPDAVYAAGGGGPLREMAKAGKATFDMQSPPTGAIAMVTGSNPVVPWVNGFAMQVANQPGPKAFLTGNTGWQQSLSGSDWFQSIIQQQPEALGQYLGTLATAAGRSPEALGQVHNQLSETDPEYQQRMRALGGQGQ